MYRVLVLGPGDQGMSACQFSISLPVWLGANFGVLLSKPPQLQ